MELARAVCGERASLTVQQCPQRRCSLRLRQPQRLARTVTASARPRYGRSARAELSHSNTHARARISSPRGGTVQLQLPPPGARRHQDSAGAAPLTLTVNSLAHDEGQEGPSYREARPPIWLTKRTDRNGADAARCRPFSQQHSPSDGHARRQASLSLWPPTSAAPAPPALPSVTCRHTS